MDVEVERRLAEIRALRAEFPRIFKSSPGPYDFTTGRGWDSLLRELFTQLDALLNDSQAAAFNFVQIKEKFGGLRAYCSIGGEKEFVANVISEEGAATLTTRPLAPAGFPREEVYAFIAQAEQRASRTCERCGEPGRLTDRRGWRSVRCFRCAQ